MLDNTKSNVLETILQTIADTCGITIDDIYSKNRKQNLVDARFIAAECLRDNDFSNEEAAMALHQNRTTMYYYHKRFIELYSVDPGFRRNAIICIENIKALLKK